jgi:Sulfotransferase domain
MLAMNSPHFLIIGAQKCGTSWLHRQLRLHPDIFIPADKDAPHFFKDPSQCENFLARFQQAPTDSIMGDANASYFWTRHSGPYPNVFNPDISAAITASLGSHIKIIILLKHPVERTISAYLHHIAHRSLGGDYSILDAPPELGIISLSRYQQHLQHWQQDIAPERLLILPAPSSSNTPYILDRVIAFLNLKRIEFFENSTEKVFEGLKRKRLDDGVWLPLNALENLGSVTVGRPHQEIDGEAYVCVIDSHELQTLATILETDIRHFNALSEKWP